jgi:DNA excision repair protein ERCC-2
VLRFDEEARTLELSVHDVLDAGPPRGSLRMSVAWSTRTRMAAGVRVHTDWQQARAVEDAAYAKEVRIQHALVVRGWEVTLTGRMDGLTQVDGRWVVEEIKSSALDRHRLASMTLSDMPRAVQQLRLYMHVLQGRGHEPAGRLVLISLHDGTERVLPVDLGVDTGAFLEAQLEWILLRHEQRMAWAARRRTVVVPMPHPTWRPGQGALAAEVHEVVNRGGHLLLSAPTGLGKTAAVLYGALQVAYATDKRVFFATARTTQQRIAVETLQAMAREGMPLKAVQIRARDKTCLNEVVACRPECCRFARGHHDRVEQSHLQDLLWAEKDGVWSVPAPDEVEELAAQHVVCPFALTMELVGRADVVIGDYNYAFDPLRRLSVLADAPEEWIIIVDEAHNLPDRAMGYGSPAVPADMVAAAIEGLHDRPDYAACLAQAKDVAAFLESGVADLLSSEEARPLDGGVDARWLQDLTRGFDDTALDYALLRWEQPAFADGTGDPWMDLARALGRVRAAVDRGGEETIAIWRDQRAREPAGLKLLCRDPAVLLRPTFEGLAGSVIMSATLAPVDFYRSTLGLDPDRTVDSQYASPFPPSNRRVVIVPDVSTEYRHRARDRDAIAAHVSAVVQAVPGNVAVYFSSFALRDSVMGAMDLADRKLIVQDRRMDEAARTEVLDTMGRGEGHVLLGVLGGIFAEGIDLPGSGLLAAVVVGPALPPVGLERKLMSRWFEDRYGSGFLYAYQVPGMARVVQAAGRVIRTPEDKGAIVLIGRRFLQRGYQAFFPEDWQPERSTVPAEALEGLWSVEEPVTESGSGR